MKLGREKVGLWLWHAAIILSAFLACAIITSRFIPGPSKHLPRTGALIIIVALIVGWIARRLLVRGGRTPTSSIVDITGGR